MSKLIRNHYRVLLIYFLLLFFGFLILLNQGKADIHLFVNQLNHPIADTFFKYITHLGDGLFSVAVIIALLFFSKRNSLMQFMAFISSGLLVQVLKRFVFKGSLRPVAFFEGIAELHLVEGVKIARLHALPSGHTATAFALFFCLIFTTRNRVLQAFYLFLALITGYSRMYLSQHFLPDVLLGSLIGVALALLSVWAVGKINSENIDLPVYKSRRSVGPRV